MSKYFYESEPFIMEEGSEIVVSPIELKKHAKERRDITSGVILKNNEPAPFYMLKVYKATKSGRKTFVGFTMTDSFGQFTIPISSTNKTEYIIKVYSPKEEIENIEMIIK